MEVNPDTITNVLRTQYLPLLTDLVFTNDILFRGPVGGQGQAGGLFPVRPKGARSWPIKTAGRTAQNYSMGQAAPAAEANAYTQATAVPEYVRGVMKVDNRVFDEITGDNQIVDVIETETADVHGSMQQMAHDIYLGLGGVAGATGFLSIFDDAINVYGVDRVGTYTDYQSSVDDTVAALALSDFSEGFKAICDPPRGAKEDSLIILTSSDQIDAYHALPGVSGSAEVAQTITPGGPIDLGYVTSTYRKRPIIKVPEFDDGTMLFIDSRYGHFQVWRDMQVEYKPTRDDTKEWHFTMGLVYVHEYPNKCHKRERLT